jgi:hypothetical protein
VHDDLGEVLTTMIIESGLENEIWIQLHLRSIRPRTPARELQVEPQVNLEKITFADRKETAEESSKLMRRPPEPICRDVRQSACLEPVCRSSRCK